MKIKFKVKRFDPEMPDRRHTFLQAYDLDVTPGMTVLEALLKISDELDPTLSFRRSCRSAICGSCAMTINGFSKLACNTQAMPEHKKHGEIIIEPLVNHTILKDLIVDFSDFWGKMNKIKPYLMPSEDAGKERCPIKKEDADLIDKSQQCIMCGCCNGSCNALEVDRRYIAPAALAKSWRFVGDVRESKQRSRLKKLSEEHGVWECVRCVHCTQYCPKGVAPLEAIEKLRSRAIEEELTDNHGAKHAVAMFDSIKRVGRLDEAAMTFKTLGFIRSVGMIPFGIKMQLHGKMPHPHLFPTIEGIEEVKKIYEAWEEDKEKKKQGR
ncbi:MAG: succinate dehydrogenase/fumarate reductase iron-sulfur subunit [Thermodesulfobacteriota bacterium]